MIKIKRTVLDSRLTLRLDQRTAQLTESKVTPERARHIWKVANSERRDIRHQLEIIALGVKRCMYCGDSFGADVDHFEPISRTPLRTFDWLNHLLACSFCNSNMKRGEYPCDASGQSLLIDPTAEDPSEHLRLILSTGEYRDLTEKGSATIRVFGLNRADLIRGRVNAFCTRRAVLCRAHDLIILGRDQEAIRCLTALTEEPHASVLHAMILSAGLPGAAEILGEDVIVALSNPRIQSLVTIHTPATA